MSQWSCIDAYSLRSENFFVQHFSFPPDPMYELLLLKEMNRKYDILMEEKACFPGGTRTRKDFKILAKWKPNAERRAARKINGEVVN